MIRWHYGRKWPVGKRAVSVYQIEKEMGYSLQEFLRQFKTFARQLEFQINNNNNDIVIIGHNKRLTIKLIEQSDRIIASLRILRLSVIFSFENYTDDQQVKFLKQFEWSFHKGGG